MTGSLYGYECKHWLQLTEAMHHFHKTLLTFIFMMKKMDTFMGENKYIWKVSNLGKITLSNTLPSRFVDTRYIYIYKCL